MKDQAAKIVCIHLLNDFSGSPKVLSQLIKAFIKKGHKVDVFTSNTKQQGFLSGIEGVNYNSFLYRWTSIKIFTLFLFFLSQVILFFKLMKYRNQEVVIYVNTVLPFGAALAGSLMKKKVIYHIHETSISPLIFKKFLFKIAELTASEAIYVSQFLMEQERMSKLNSHLVYNALSEEFIAKGNLSEPRLDKPFTVLMLCSLKEYKGVNEFVELAANLAHINYELVLNSSQAQIDQFFKNKILPKNLQVFPSQSNVHAFYERANLVLNLSHPDKWVETFGMTALEAMCYGIPVIVPPVGGIAELVEDTKNGFRIDVRAIKELSSTIKELSQNSKLYHLCSGAAREKSKQFKPSIMAGQILQLIHS